MKRANSIKLALRRGALQGLVLAPLTFLLVAGAGCPSLFESSSQRAVKVKQAVPGTDKVGNITSTTGETVNGYARLGADVDAGATTVTYSNPDNKGIFATLAKGDLLLIIQMQGATLTDSSCTSSGYGEMDLGNAGRYEFIGVEAVSGTTITLACALKHSYVRDSGTQLVRVPQYSKLTVADNAFITAPPWNGTTGGVVAVHVQETAELNNTTGSISVSGLGFRGGVTDNRSANYPAGVTSYCSTDSAQGAEKGEGVAGFEAAYSTGRYGRGAPANGGGGGNAHNAGGGGGANAAVPGGTWSGFGVTEDCGTGASWTTAWRLDDQLGDACSDSPGGGRGGYSYSDPPNTNTLPTTTKPGSTAWGGDHRETVGGLGGRPLSPSPAERLFMGGGGGAGDGNDNHAGAGGPGGGIVFLIAGQVTGAGSIVADGAHGGDALATPPGGDAAGGGGGGGTVLVNAVSIDDTIVISAKGGRGGNQGADVSNTEVEGPGGGGGGGYVALSVTGPDLSHAADGGPAGRTAIRSMSTFPVDGATAGRAGATNGDATTMLFCGGAPHTSFVLKPAKITKDTTATFTFANTADPVTYQCRLDSSTDPFGPCIGPDAAAGVSGFVVTGLKDGTHTLYVQSTDSYGNVESPPATYVWTVDTIAPATSFKNAPTKSSTDAVGVFVFQASETPVTYECRLDSTADNAWSPCNNGTLAAPDPNYSTPPLGNGPHTLCVRATDAAGNVETALVTDVNCWTWDIAVVYLDGGVLDVGGPQLDVEYLDVERLDVEEPVDTGPADLPTTDDVIEQLDTELVKEDVPSVQPDLGKRDVGIVVAVDAERLDTQVLDVEREVLLPPIDVGAGDLGPDSAVMGPDTAPAFGPEPSPDTAPPATEPDAAVSPGNEDAAEPLPGTEIKVLGGGFCAMSHSRSTSPSGLALLSLAALALLRRRRR